MADKLKYSNPITVKSYKTDGTEDDGKVISNLSEQINAISDSLGLEDSITLQIKEKFNSYDDKIFTMIDNPQLTDLINELLKADNELNKILAPGNEFESIAGFKENWNKLMTQFLHLQGLIIIKKINKNIGVGINSIIEALVNKLTVINNLIEQNLL